MTNFSKTRNNDGICGEGLRPLRVKLKYDGDNMYKAIVVDDEKMSCEFIKKYMSQNDCGFEITKSFTDPFEALSYIKDNSVELVITDIRMPELNGLELIKTINEAKPETKIMIMSGYSEFEYAHIAIKYNVFDYVLKPIDVDELTESLLKLKKIFDEDEEKKAENFENTERFFTMLINSKLNKVSVIDAEMKKINLPEHIEDMNGEILSLEFLNFKNYSVENWKYGKKRLLTAIVNVLNLHFHYKYVYCISENTGFFTLIVFFENNIKPVSDKDIINTYKSYINVDIKILSRNLFGNIYEIPDVMKFKDNAGKDFDKLSEEALNKKTNETKSKIEQYIYDNYMLDITRDDAANAMYISPSYFSIYFKNLMGVSFKEYLLSVRIEKAKFFLVDGVNPKEITKMVGYNEYRYFKKNFFEYTGMYPEEYQKKILQSRGHDEKI